jgi:hypothetical protein
MKFRRLTWIPAGALLLALPLVSPLATADAVPSVTCQSLSISLSDDKNFYIFNASAAGDASTITGYRFDFGDHQSYDFTFSGASTQDRHSASVTHTYMTAGAYTASVQVNTKTAGKVARISSAACRAPITIAPPGSSLVNTGAGNVVALFAGTSLLGTLLYQIWIRRQATNR